MPLTQYAPAQMLRVCCRFRRGAAYAAADLVQTRRIEYQRVADKSTVFRIFVCRPPEHEIVLSAGTQKHPPMRGGRTCKISPKGDTEEHGQPNINGCKRRNSRALREGVAKAADKDAKDGGVFSEAPPCKVLLRFTRRNSGGLRSCCFRLQLKRFERKPSLAGCAKPYSLGAFDQSYV